MNGLVHVLRLLARLLGFHSDWVQPLIARSDGRVESGPLRSVGDWDRMTTNAPPDRRDRMCDDESGYSGHRPNAR